MPLMSKLQRKSDMRYCIILAALTLAACGPKTRLVPQAYMPTPPAILMQAPKELHTIKKNEQQEEVPEND